jgi:osmotically-inducible protein OsmY
MGFSRRGHVVQLDSESTKKRAEEAARGVPGVQSVDHGLRVTASAGRSWI